MLTEPISKTVNPTKLAKAGVVLEGCVHLHQLERLSEYELDGDEKVNFRFQFKKHRDGKVRISGQLGTSIMLPCQTCLEPVNLEIDEKIELIIVNSEEEAAQLDPEQDSLLVLDDKVEVSQLLEDELILALPMVARHIDADGLSTCKDVLVYKKSDGNFVHDKPNPFAELNKLKDWDLE